MDKMKTAHKHVDQSIVSKIKFLPYSVGVHHTLLSGEVHDSELVDTAQIDEDVRIVFKWLYTFEKLECLIVILLFKPLLFHTISKFHSPFTPYTLFILCMLLLNLIIQTISPIAQLIHLPIIKPGSFLCHPVV